MPGTGRPADPLWFAIGFAAGIICVWVHQIWAGVGIGIVVDGAMGLIREDAKRH